MNPAKRFHLYLLLCDQHVIYTGIAIDPQARLEQHRHGAPHGAKFTRRFSQLELVYQVAVGDQAMAQQLEYQIKQLSRSVKERIIHQQPTLQELLVLTTKTKTAK